MDISITITFAAITAILMAILSVQVGIKRGQTKIALGYGDNDNLHLRMRRFGNLSEYAPMVLLLLLLMELKGISPQYLYTYGGIFIALRLLHPIVLFGDENPPKWKMAGRFISAAGTALLMVLAAGALILY